MLDSLDTLIAFVLIMLVVSLLITIGVQVVAAVLNLRGLNLLNGLGNTFRIMAPDLVQDTSELARAILKGRVVSDSFLPNWGIFKLWRHATAIRPDEVFDGVHRIAIAKKAPDDENLRQTAQSILVALGVDRGVLQATARQILSAQLSVSNVAANIKEVLDQIPDVRARQKVEGLANAAISKAGAIEAETIAAAEKGLVTAAASIDTAYRKFNYWTEICEERVQQWFTMHTRIITVVFAFVFAFWLQLDTVDIFKLVSSDKAVRDKLVAQAGAVEAQTANMLADSSAMLQKAVKSWGEKQTDPALRDALNKIDIQSTDTRDVVHGKVTSALKTDALKGKTPVDNFDSIVNDTVTKRLDKKAGDFSQVKADFEKTGFDLFPKTNRYRWGSHWSDGFGRHLTGMLFSVALLSLGAPFWYNALKNLTSLRSAVAQNISKEQEQEQAQKQGNGTAPEAPPTVK